MTESEWLACSDPNAMLAFMESKASDRKLRLYACACCRRIWHLLSDERSRTAVEVAERFADNHVSVEQLDEAAYAAEAAAEAASGAEPHAPDAAHAAFGAAAPSDYAHPAYIAAYEAPHDAATAIAHFRAVDEPMPIWETAKEVERALQCHLLRDVFNNPGQLVAIDPTWRSTNVVGLARAIYEERAFDRMPELADALEETQCANEQILNHCREPSEHVRGCWVVDVLLGQA